MMQPVTRVHAESADPLDGQIVLDPTKAAWNLGMIGGAVAFAPATVSIGAILVFVVLTYTGLLLGHSVGMHRFMIHRTFDAPRWLERLLVYIGVLVGMSGPFGVIGIHDLRDWAQRQPDCHDFFSHRRSYFRDVLWQLTCVFRFEKPPTVTIERRFADDPWFRWMDATWRYQQLLLAMPLYAAGGWAWVVWGVFVRVAVCNVGHWTITYFCHNPGPGSWFVRDAGVQASDMPGLGLISCGECWHSNHHAFPESARIGLEPGQFDPGWQIIRLLRDLGLAENVGLPRTRDERGDLIPRGDATQTASLPR